MKLFQDCLMSVGHFLPLNAIYFFSLTNQKNYNQLLNNNLFLKQYCKFNHNFNSVYQQVQNKNHIEQNILNLISDFVYDNVLNDNKTNLDKNLLQINYTINKSFLFISKHIQHYFNQHHFMIHSKQGNILKIDENDILNKKKVFNELLRLKNNDIDLTEIHPNIPKLFNKLLINKNKKNSLTIQFYQKISKWTQHYQSRINQYNIPYVTTKDNKTLNVYLPLLDSKSITTTYYFNLITNLIQSTNNNIKTIIFCNLNKEEKKLRIYKINNL